MHGPVLPVSHPVESSLLDGGQKAFSRTMRGMARIKLVMGVGGLYSFSGLGFCAAGIGNWYSAIGCAAFGLLMAKSVAEARRELRVYK